jgi:hypothetical protein
MGCPAPLHPGVESQHSGSRLTEVLTPAAARHRCAFPLFRHIVRESISAGTPQEIVAKHLPIFAHAPIFSTRVMYNAATIAYFIQRFLHLLASR